MKRRIRSLFCRCRKRARPRPRSLRDREQEQPPPGDPAPRRTAQAPGAAMRGPGHRRTALEEDQGGAGGDLPAQDPAGDGRVDPRVAAPPPEGPRQHRPAAHGLHGDREGNLAAAARGGAGVAPNRRGIVLCEGRRMAGHRDRDCDRPWPPSRLCIPDTARAPWSSGGGTKCLARVGKGERQAHSRAWGWLGGVG